MRQLRGAECKAQITAIANSLILSSDSFVADFRTTSRCLISY
jgi:hypothetical protein